MSRFSVFGFPASPKYGNARNTRRLLRLSRMKKLRWGDFVGTAALFFSVFAYFRPPDPNHPVSFDWVSSRIEIPLWQAFLTLGVIAWATAFVVRRLERRSIGMTPSCRSATVTVTPEKQSSGQVPPIPNLRPASKATKGTPANPPGLPRSARPPDMSPEVARIMDRMLFSELCSFASTDHYRLQIVEHEEGSRKGLMVRISNYSLKSICGYRLHVERPRSFDHGHNDYRDGKEFAPFDIQRNEVVHASYTGQPQWLVYKEASMPHLVLGSDNSLPLP